MASRKAQLRVLTLMFDHTFILSGWDNRVLSSLAELGYATSSRAVDVRGGGNAVRVWQITEAGRHARTRWVAQADLGIIAA